jgi:prepilin-type processing-associated H-X9-DG protein
MDGWRSWTYQQMIDVGCPDWNSHPDLAGRPGVRYMPFDEDLGGYSDFVGSNAGGYNLVPAGNPGAYEQSYPRLKEGVERFFITDINNPAGAAAAQSTLGVMWDSFGGNYERLLDVDSSHFAEEALDTAVNRFNHVPGGSNVLFMDGHVEFVRFDSGYPCTLTSPATGQYSVAVELMVNRAGGAG